MSGCALNWRAFRRAVAASGVLLCAAACGGRHPASEERVLHIYNWADYIGHGTIAEFERRTHIKVVLRARLYLPAELGADYDRLRTRVWTHIKTGQ